MDRKTVVIRLELRLAKDSLSGRASDGTGAAKDFEGWLGLISAIDSLVPGIPSLSDVPEATASEAPPDE